MPDQLISKSVKNRYPARYLSREGKIINKKDDFPRAFKMVVEMEEIGKNKKGKKIFHSRTKHVFA